MFAPVGGYVFIDNAGALIPDFGGIAIWAYRTEDSLPDVPLFAGAAVGSQDQLPAIGALGGGLNQAGGGAHLWLRNASKRADGPVGVVVVVNIHGLVGAKIDRVRTRAPGAVVIIGIKNLRG